MAQEYSQMAFLAASVAVGQGYSVDRVLKTLERFFLRELERGGVNFCLYR